MKNLVFIIITLTGALFSSSNVLVKLTSEIPYVNINDNGVDVKIQRIQDTSNRLTDDYAKTSRVCPPHCIPNIKVTDGVKTIGELELIDFIQKNVYKRKGILVDARDKARYILETIPGAINIPEAITEVNSKKIIDNLFKTLGAKKTDNGYDFSNAKDMAVFCSGLWCHASTKFIKNMVKNGYPSSKIFWYRDGLQAWKLLGLTTVVHQASEVKK